MLKIKDEGIVLEKSKEPFESQAVLNPTCLEKDGVVHMFYRAVAKKGMVSSIGYCRLQDNKVIYRSPVPIIYPQHSYEKGGTEDPRLVFLEGTYYLFYTAYDGKNALIAYATSSDLVRFTKKGVISPKMTYDKAEDLFGKSKVRERYHFFEAFFKDRHGKDVLLWEKDAFLFPKKIKGKFALVHRVPPGIQVAYFKDFKDLTPTYWKRYLARLKQFIILDPIHGFESKHIGGGCPPIETSAGWVFIYHAVEDSAFGSVYHAAVALLDKDDPTKVIGRLESPLFSPEEGRGIKGDVNNVVFPTGTLVKGDRLTIYYGAGDKFIAAKSLSLKALLASFKVRF